MSALLRAMTVALAGLFLVASGGALGVSHAVRSDIASTNPSTAQVGAFFNITMEDLRFVPSEFHAPPNTTVHLRLTQRDSIEHTFTLSMDKDFVLPRDRSPSEVDAYFVNNNFTDVAVAGSAGTVAWANFTTPAETGRYEFVCRIGGHFQSGMLGFMIVEVREVFVNLTTEGFRFVPDTFHAFPGSLVHARITQRDLAEHTFTLGAEKDVTLPTEWSPSQLDTHLRDNNLTDVFLPGVLDVSVSVNFTAPLEPGRYEFVCRIGGHFQTGMFGFMIVSEEPVGPMGGPPLGIVPAVLLVALAGVLVFAVVYEVRARRAAQRRK
jgi:uncharacterized cupredoxin-like copper-binding protein